MIRFCSLLIALASPVFADIEGEVHVVDGDTFQVAGVSVRLHGIDAPEVAQMCDDAQGVTWACGAFVGEEVRRQYEGRTAICEEIDTDRYGRVVAKCYVDGQDVGAQIVRDGWAEAYRHYSMDYDLIEKTAQVRGEGLWSGTMQSPAAFRADQRAQTATPPPNANCFIKGNISGSGRIYHMPHNADYENTRITTSRGERWFCSEAEARSAGWRAARN